MVNRLRQSSVSRTFGEIGRIDTGGNLPDFASLFQLGKLRLLTNLSLDEKMTS